MNREKFIEKINKVIFIVENKMCCQTCIELGKIFNFEAKINTEYNKSIKHLFMNQDGFQDGFQHSFLDWDRILKHKTYDNMRKYRVKLLTDFKEQCLKDKSYLDTLE